MNDQTDKRRAEFEKWFTQSGKWMRGCERDSSGSYKLMSASTAWDTWNAALDAAAPVGGLDLRHIAASVISACAEKTGINIWPEDSDALSELLDVCEDAAQTTASAQGGEKCAHGRESDEYCSTCDAKEHYARHNQAQPPQAPNADAIYAECAEICERVGLAMLEQDRQNFADGALLCRDAIEAKMGVG